MENKEIEVNKLKILHITNSIDGGGVGFVIANFCTEQVGKGISFDIVAENIGRKQRLHERFATAGFGIHYVIPKKKSLWRNVVQMARLMKKGHYDGVHVHFEEWSFLYLMLAWLCGIPMRVCHAHMAYMPGSDTKPHYKLFRVLLNLFATTRLACSKDAGSHLFRRHPYIVLNNAIDSKAYRFDCNKRERMRAKLNVEGKLVIGVVGRLTFQKNPQMSIEILREIRKKRKDAVMIMVGTGALKKEIIQLIETYDLVDAVRP